MTIFEQVALWVGFFASIITLLQAIIWIFRWASTPRQQSEPTEVEVRPIPVDVEPLTDLEREELEYHRRRSRLTTIYQTNFAFVVSLFYLVVAEVVNPGTVRQLVTVWEQFLNPIIFQIRQYLGLG